MWIRKLVLISMVLALLHGCVNLNANPAEQLLGKWQVDIVGVELIVEYTQTTVQVGDSAPVPYALTGNQLTFTNGGSQKRVIMFSSKREMTQTDPLTQTERIYTRL